MILSLVLKSNIGEGLCTQSASTKAILCFTSTSLSKAWVQSLEILGVWVFSNINQNRIHRPLVLEFSPIEITVTMVEINLQLPRKTTRETCSCGINK